MDTQDVILNEIDKQADLISSLCADGVLDEDRYDKVCEIINLFMRIDKLTQDQNKTFESLMSVTEDYQEIHFPYGN